MSAVKIFLKMMRYNNINSTFKLKITSKRWVIPGVFERYRNDENQRVYTIYLYFFKYEYSIRGTEYTRNSCLFPNTIASQEFPDTSR